MNIPTHPLLSADNTPSLIEVKRATKKDPLRDPTFLIPHRKGYYLFVLVKEGGSRHWIDQRPYTLQPNNFYFTIPPQVHLKEETPSLEGMVLCFTPAFLQLEESPINDAYPILQNKADGHALTLGSHHLVYIENLMEQMLEEFQSTRRWKNKMLSTLLQTLLIYLSRLYTEQFDNAQVIKDHPMFKRFLSLVQQHYTTLHEVQDYADLLHITPGHLNDLVKRQSGYTCIAHIQQHLIVESKRRLMYTSLSVKEIAEELGFEDPSYFIRVFKRNEKMTPLAWRSTNLEMYH